MSSTTTEHISNTRTDTGEARDSQDGRPVPNDTPEAVTLTAEEQAIASQWPELSAEEVQQLACGGNGLVDAIANRFRLSRDEAGKAVLSFLRQQSDEVRDALATSSALPKPCDHREANWPVESIFLRRWSPRAMTGESISNAELMTLLEAARWAPSTYNEQEWRYLYAHRKSEDWGMFFSLLVDANQSWCKNAGVLILVASRTRMSSNDKPNPVHSFDAGASFENLALQGTAMRLVVHAMAGFDREKAREQLQIPENFEPEAMVAVGRPGDPQDLPEKLQEMEKPSSRKPLKEICCAGRFDF